MYKSMKNSVKVKKLFTLKQRFFGFEVLSKTFIHKNIFYPHSKNVFSPLLVYVFDLFPLYKGTYK